MNIYLICPVRMIDGAIDPEVKAYVDKLEAEGHSVHYPPRDVDQNDPTGERICSEHLAAMIKADRVDVFWNSESKGSHFDAGMAYALNKPFKIVRAYNQDNEGKSYLKVLLSLDGD